MAEDLLFSGNARFVTHNRQVVATNQFVGEWIRFSEECYRYLLQAMEAGFSRSAFLACFRDRDDRLYMEKLLRGLESIKVLADSEQLEKEKEVSLRSVTLMLTNRCNLSCRHCAANAADGTKRDFLSTAAIKGIIDKVMVCHPESIILTGGEPLIRKDFLEILRHIVSYGEARVVVMTNATLITPLMAKELAGCVESVDISLDGFDEESCCGIRGKGVFDRVLRSISLLQQNGLDKISLSMVSLGRDQAAEKKFHDLCEGLRVKPVVRRLSYTGRAKENEEYFDGREKEQRICDRHLPSEQQIKSVMKACSCRAGVETLNVSDTGEIYPCGTFDGEMDSLGNMMEIESVRKFLEEQRQRVSRNAEKFYRYLPYKGDICADCCVRYFCWTCPYAALDRLEKSHKLAAYCAGQKAFLSRMVWGEECHG
ncbi:MAG: radical SAM protein [Clostridium sp.]|jgi:radical SAM protein with 4Fe4S-binding SPASM domain|nr:radical SAM protein [Clostridium sp.]